MHPPDYLKVTFTCVSIDPEIRPAAIDLIREMRRLSEQQKNAEAELNHAKPVVSQRKLIDVLDVPRTPRRRKLKKHKCRFRGLRTRALFNAMKSSLL